MRTKKSVALASATLALILTAGLGATSATAAEPAQAMKSVSAIAVKTTFNPDACLIKTGWNDRYKTINGVRHRLWGQLATYVVKVCPTGYWKPYP